MKENIIFKIRKAKKEDVPEIMEILKTANMHYIPSPEMPELDYRCIFVAEDKKGKVLGMAGYKILDDKRAKTTLMVVLPAYRGIGIGTALQRRRMKMLKKRGIRKLTTNSDRPESISWYQKHFGYNVVGKLPKLHEFGVPDIMEWTTLEVDLQTWEEE